MTGLKAILFLAVVVCAALGMAVAASGERPVQLTQEAPDRWEAVSLSPAEQVEIQQGKVVLRELPVRGKKGRTFEAVGIFTATLDEVLGIVTDFRRYDEFMPRVERIVVTDVSETVFLVEQYLKLPLGVHRRYRLRYMVRHEAEGFRIDWVKVPWPEVPLGHSVLDTSGYWQVGHFGEGRLLAVYRVYTDPGKVPLGMKGLVLSLSKREIPKVVERVRERLKAGAGSRPVKD
jgi:hypothetical protein